MRSQNGSSKVTIPQGPPGECPLTTRPPTRKKGHSYPRILASNNPRNKVQSPDEFPVPGVRTQLITVTGLKALTAVSS